MNSVVVLVVYRLNSLANILGGHFVEIDVRQHCIYLCEVYLACVWVRPVVKEMPSSLCDTRVPLMFPLADEISYVVHKLQWSSTLPRIARGALVRL